MAFESVLISFRLLLWVSRKLSSAALLLIAAAHESSRGSLFLPLPSPFGCIISSHCEFPFSWMTHWRGDNRHSRAVLASTFKWSLGPLRSGSLMFSKPPSLPCLFLLPSRLFLFCINSSNQDACGHK